MPFPAHHKKTKSDRNTVNLAALSAAGIVSVSGVTAFFGDAIVTTAPNCGFLREQNQTDSMFSLVAKTLFTKLTNRRSVANQLGVLAVDAAAHWARHGSYLLEAIVVHLWHLVS